jgi:hypothetical protein
MANDSKGDCVMKAKTTSEARPQDENETGGTGDDVHAPRKVTLAQNIILSMKVLAVAGLLIAALWGISRKGTAPPFWLC